MTKTQRGIPLSKKKSKLLNGSHILYQASFEPKRFALGRFAEERKASDARLAEQRTSARNIQIKDIEDQQ